MSMADSADQAGALFGREAGLGGRAGSSAPTSP
jgi:hypothetical protein